MNDTLQRIEMMRNKIDISALQMCKEIGLAQSTYATWIKDDRMPRADKLKLFADYFNVTVSWLINGEEPGSAPKIPVVSTIRAGMPVATYQDVLGYEEITEKMAEAGEHICLKVKGDSMSPVIQDGDLVIVRLQSDVESGDIAVVRINGDEATLKEVKKSKAGITLIGYNTAVYTPHFYSNEEIESLPIEIDGKVVEMKRSF